jgi:hypothetical protein
MSKDKNAEKINVENERKWQEKPSLPSPSLIDPRLHPHFCFRHFYLSTKVGFTPASPSLKTASLQRKKIKDKISVRNSNANKRDHFSDDRML